METTENFILLFFQDVNIFSKKFFQAINNVIRNNFLSIQRALKVVKVLLKN